MTSTDNTIQGTERLQALYRQATRGLPNDADRRLGSDELLALARGESLGARHESALQGIADSSDQALVLRLLSDTRSLSEALSRQVNVLRRPSLGDQVRAWWRSAGMPPVFASAGIALMAVLGFQFLGSAPLPTDLTAQSPLATPIETPLFNGAFEAGDQLFAASLEGAERSDAVFGGDFDS
jgi:hypothetical protein